uniref:PHD domain-containing protein n=1 Tax=Haemonchus contortus TaxID=6289 RepID=A0A7I4Y5B6_HAECO
MRKRGFRCQLEMMLKRTELRLGRKKHGIPPLIAEDIEGDDELDLCAVCDRREPPGDLTDTENATIDWVQCDECHSWAHLNCIRARECVCCGAGTFEITACNNSDDTQEGQDRRRISSVGSILYFT